MNTNDTFEIRTYGKSELAMLYFPKAETCSGAMSNLRYWIRRNSALLADLRDCSMPPRSKSFTPKEVSLIIHHLGEPST